MIGMAIDGTGKEEIDYFIKAIEAIKEINNNPSSGYVVRRRLVEHIKVDFVIMEERLLSVIRMVNEGKVTKEDYRNAFYKLWSDNAPSVFVNVLEHGVKKELRGAIAFMELILEMGDKVYVLLDSDLRVCVSVEIPPIPCEKCYFTSICKLAVKNKVK